MITAGTIFIRTREKATKGHNSRVQKPLGGGGLASYNFKAEWNSSTN
jgi:hypothetical protein